MCDCNGGVKKGKKKPNSKPSEKKTCPKLVKITVIQNATQTNVTGAKNWACVKKTTDDVVVQATTSPNNNATEWEKITWSGDSGAEVTGKKNQRKLSRATSKKFHVKAELGGVSDELFVWVVWADLEVKIGAGDTIDAGNDATGLAAGHKWPAMLGGGNKLGEMTCEGTILTYAYTIGKIQAKATLSPSGIEDVIRNYWLMKRTRTNISFDNGVETTNNTNHDDTSSNIYLDLDPKSGSSTREIYDLDAPGCSASLAGTNITHTAETYVNFNQYVEVKLDSDEKCSDDVLWSYEARIDVDKVNNKVELNKLRLSHIAIPVTRHYPTR